MSTPTYTYTAAFATEDYLKSNRSWGTKHLDRIRQDSRYYEQLDNSQCIDRYCNRLNNGKDVIIITKKSSLQNNNSTLLGTYDLKHFPGDGFWVCSGPHYRHHCSKWYMKQIATNWTVLYEGWPHDGSTFHPDGDTRRTALVLSCRSAGVHSDNNKCGLHFSTSIMIFVCILNLSKCLLVCWTAYYVRNSEPLVTAGDAIMSFLQVPDDHTQKMSGRSRHEFPQGGHWNSEPKTWSPQRTGWYRAASRKRWVATLLLYDIPP